VEHTSVPVLLTGFGNAYDGQRRHQRKGSQDEDHKYTKAAALSTTSAMDTSVDDGPTDTLLGHMSALLKANPVAPSIIIDYHDDIVSKGGSIHYLAPEIKDALPGNVSAISSHGDNLRGYDDCHV
jgi:hypothetical protein